jgi:hypothetical protein
MSFIEYLRSSKCKAEGSLYLANTEKYSYWPKSTDITLDPGELQAVFPIRYFETLNKN